MILIYTDNEFLAELRDLLQKHDVTIDLTTGLDVDGEVKPLISFNKKVSNQQWVEIFGSFNDIHYNSIPEEL